MAFEGGIDEKLENPGRRALLKKAAGVMAGLGTLSGVAVADENHSSSQAVTAIQSETGNLKNQLLAKKDQGGSIEVETEANGFTIPSLTLPTLVAISALGLYAYNRHLDKKIKNSFLEIGNNYIENPTSLTGLTEQLERDLTLLRDYLSEIRPNDSEFWDSLGNLTNLSLKELKTKHNNDVALIKDLYIALFLKKDILKLEHLLEELIHIKGAIFLKNTDAVNQMEVIELGEVISKYALFIEERS